MTEMFFKNVLLLLLLQKLEPFIVEMSDEGKLYFCLLGNMQIHVAYEGKY